ncbi:AraC family transcriptional regulator [Alteromonadaceae bacterium 2753L.S.0a.02]|nr:AraC family transcriptional regulator [Alteromonadaceae bacterium 2753L.S.0a.02]
MHELINTTRKILQENTDLPFSVYTSVEVQNIFNVPIIKPLLVCVLNGCKRLGEQKDISCYAGNFIFLSNSPKINMRNIPGSNEYFALLIDFDFTDFECLPVSQNPIITHFQGSIDPLLKNTLQQFLSWSAVASPELWPLRRKEILQVLLHQGYQQVCRIMESPSLSHKLHTIIGQDVATDFSATELANMLAMSESTLRRRLQSEGLNLQTIKDRAKLGFGLHLVQTSNDPVGRIAERCGYLSQSRFTEKFKQLFGVTPSEIRKTQLRE